VNVTSNVRTLSPAPSLQDRSRAMGWEVEDGNSGFFVPSDASPSLSFLQATLLAQILSYHVLIGSYNTSSVANAPDHTIARTTLQVRVLFLLFRPHLLLKPLLLLLTICFSRFLSIVGRHLRENWWREVRYTFSFPLHSLLFSLARPRSNPERICSLSSSSVFTEDKLSFSTRTTALESR